MSRPNPTAVDLLEPQAADDTRLTERLARLVNDVYAVAEAGLWRDGADRTTTGSIEDTHPHLAPLLATPCDLAVFERPPGS
jgi:hypothetical protein